MSQSTESISPFEQAISDRFDEIYGSDYRKSPKGSKTYLHFFRWTAERRPILSVGGAYKVLVVLKLDIAKVLKP